MSMDPSRQNLSQRCTILFIHLGSLLRVALTVPDRRIMVLTARDNFASKFKDHDVWQVQCNHSLLDPHLLIYDDINKIIGEYGLRQLNRGRLLVVVLGFGRILDSKLAELRHPKSQIGSNLLAIRKNIKYPVLFAGLSELPMKFPTIGDAPVRARWLADTLDDLSNRKIELANEKVIVSDVITPQKMSSLGILTIDNIPELVETRQHLNPCIGDLQGVVLSALDQLYCSF